MIRATVNGKHLHNHKGEALLCQANDLVDSTTSSRSDCSSTVYFTKKSRSRVTFIRFSLALPVRLVGLHPDGDGVSQVASLYVR